jgi:hypothetical protein
MAKKRSPEGTMAQYMEGLKAADFNKRLGNPDMSAFDNYANSSSLYGQARRAFDLEQKRINKVRSNIGSMAREHAEQGSRYSDVGISDNMANWIDREGFSCNAYSCGIMQGAGATIPEDSEPMKIGGRVYNPGDKIPIIPGNGKFNSKAKDLGFELQPKGTLPDEKGDLIRGHMYSVGTAGDSGSYHSVLSGGRDKDTGEIDVYNNSGEVYDGYKHSRFTTDDKDYYTKDSGVMRYVGNLPQRREAFEKTKEDFKKLNMPKAPTLPPQMAFGGPTNNNIMFPKMDYGMMGYPQQAQPLAPEYATRNEYMYKNGGPIKGGCGCGSKAKGGPTTCGCGKAIPKADLGKDLGKLNTFLEGDTGSQLMNTVGELAPIVSGMFKGSNNQPQGGGYQQPTNPYMMMSPYAGMAYGQMNPYMQQPQQQQTPLYGGFTMGGMDAAQARSMGMPNQFANGGPTGKGWKSKSKEPLGREDERAIGIYTNNKVDRDLRRWGMSQKSKHEQDAREQLLKGDFGLWPVQGYPNDYYPGYNNGGPIPEYANGAVLQGIGKGLQAASPFLSLTPLGPLGSMAGAAAGKGLEMWGNNKEKKSIAEDAASLEQPTFMQPQAQAPQQSMYAGVQGAGASLTGYGPGANMAYGNYFNNGGFTPDTDLPKTLDAVDVNAPIDVYKGGPNWDNYQKFLTDTKLHEDNQKQLAMMEAEGFTPYKTLSVDDFQGTKTNREARGTADFWSSPNVQGYTIPKGGGDTPGFGGQTIQSTATNRMYVPSYPKPVGNYNVVLSPDEQRMQKETAFRESVAGGQKKLGYERDGILWGNEYTFNDGRATVQDPNNSIEDYNTKYGTNYGPGWVKRANGGATHPQAQYKAEAEEIVYHPNDRPVTLANGGLNQVSNDYSKITGDKHTAPNGGVDMAGGKDGYIFSDQLKVSKGLLNSLKDLI